MVVKNRELTLMTMELAQTLYAQAHVTTPPSQIVDL